MTRDMVLSLWEAHKMDPWPRLTSQQEGPLMTLDTVISGCVVYYLDSLDGLDAQRRTIVGDCLTDLDTFSVTRVGVNWSGSLFPDLRNFNNIFFHGRQKTEKFSLFTCWHLKGIQRFDQVFDQRSEIRV